MVSGNGKDCVTSDIALDGTEVGSAASDGIGVLKDGAYSIGRTDSEEDWEKHSVASGDKQHCISADVSCSPFSGIETGTCKLGKEEACRCGNESGRPLSGRPLSGIETGNFCGEERTTRSEDKETCRSINEADASGRLSIGEETGIYEEKRVLSAASEDKGTC
jgi:hypothetical protein